MFYIKMKLPSCINGCILYAGYLTATIVICIVLYTLMKVCPLNILMVPIFIRYKSELA